MIWFILLAVAAPFSGCQPLQQDHIFGRDLARAVPELGRLAPDADLGPAPIPGSARVFQVRELRRIAAANQIDAQPLHDVCFAWVTKPVPRQSIEDAMRRALAPREVHIEVLEQSLWPAPEGEIVFSPSSLSLGANGIVLWHGYIAYAPARRFDVWARAKISVKENRLITTEKVASGHPLGAAQLRSEIYEGALTRTEPFTSIEQVLGLRPKFDLPAGTVLTRELLELPYDVERGDTLSVASQNGHARVLAECIAEENGRVGDTIPVHNARSGRRFRALIDGKGKAIVASTDALGLLADDARR